MEGQIGKRVGEYQLDQLIGCGTAGCVFRAHRVHSVHAPPAAVKLLHPQWTASREFIIRFRQHSRLVRELRHAHVAATLDDSEHEGQLALIMELLDGSLRTLLRPMDDAAAEQWLPVGLELALQAAEGLAYAHGRGLVHGNVKPENLLLRKPADTVEGDGPSYLLKVSDWGLLRLLAADHSGQEMPAGTPVYLSPEQCRGAEADERSDLYSLGVVLYEVATGWLPSTVTTPEEAIEWHRTGTLARPSAVRPELAERYPGLEAIILRCLAKAPEARFASAAELSGALRQLLAQPPPVADSATEPVKVPPPGSAPAPKAPASTHTPLSESAPPGKTDSEGTEQAPKDPPVLRKDPPAPPDRRRLAAILALAVPLLAAGARWAWIRSHRTVPAHHVAPAASTADAFSSESEGGNRFTVTYDELPVLTESEPFEDWLPQKRADRLAFRLNDNVGDLATTSATVANVLEGTRFKHPIVFFEYAHQEEDYIGDLLLTVDEPTARDCGQTDPVRLACWWRDLIRDYLLLNQGKPPAYPSGHPPGPLVSLYGRLHHLGVDPAHPPTREQVKQVRAELVLQDPSGFNELHHLYQTIPADYDPQPDNIVDPHIKDEGEGRSQTR